MRFLRTFIGLTYFVAGLGFTALILTGDTGSLSLIAMLLGLMGSRGALRRLAPSETAWRLLTVLFVGYAVLSYASFGVPALTIARELLIYLQVNRLYVRRVNRDYGHIYLLAFLQILLGCILTISPLFAVILVAFMIASAWALMLLQLKIGLDEQLALEEELEPRSRVAAAAAALGGEKGRGSAAAGTGQDDLTRYEGASRLLRLPFLAASAGVVLLMLAGTIVLFLLTPRMEINAFQRRLAPTIHVAGFSEEVGLGEVGRILNRRDRVMRVRIERGAEALPVTPYWRGLALDQFDGRTWRLSSSRTDLVRTRPLFLGRGRLPNGTNVIQRYTLEPLDSNVLFALPRVLEIEASHPSVLRTFTQSYQVLDKPGRLDYVVYSTVGEPTPDELRADRSQMRGGLASIYLQLPPMSERVHALAGTLTAGATSSYDKLKAIERHLRGFTYTLEPRSQGEAPLEDFLFRTKAGHCEYFASAMVVLSRAAGIPARVVNGFLGGELNPIGGYYVVRQKDAHSWVEVWFNEHGWVRFDPTPAGAIVDEGGGTGLERQIAFYLDFLEMQWYHYVLDYDLRAQLELFSDLITPGPGGSEREFFEERSEPVDRAAMLRWAAVLLVVGAVAAALYWLTRGRRAGEEESPVRSTPEGRQFLRYRSRMHRELERRGFTRRLGETPLERAERAGRVLGSVELLRRVEEVYYAACYGRIPLEAGEVAEAESAMRYLKRLPLGRPEAREGGRPPAAR